MGVAEAQVRIAEQQAQMMRRLIESVMDELELTAKQRELLGPALRKHMADMIQSTGREVARA